MRTVLLVALFAARAYADERPPEPAVSAPAFGWQADFGVLGGTYYVDGAATRAGGVAFDGGLRAGILALVGEVAAFELSSQQAMPPIVGSHAAALDGQLIRLGVTARVCSGCTSKSPLRFWLEAGPGREWIDWTAGGSLARTDGMIGAGAAFGNVGSAWGGIQLRIVAVVARSHDAAIGLCGGPCDTLTGPSGWDRTFLFELGIGYMK
jgi:hypothetical protein